MHVKISGMKDNIPITKWNLRSEKHSPLLEQLKKTFWRLFSHILHELVLQKQHPSFHWYDKKIKIMITMLVNKNINDDWMISFDI